MPPRRSIAKLPACPLRRLEASQMKLLFKWLGIVLGSVAGVAVAGVLYVFFASEAVVARTYEVPLTDFDAPSDAASVARGGQLATRYGCHNCHGKEFEGYVMFDEPNVAKIAAPNLTRAVKDYSDAEFERLMRHGVKHDGTSTWIMPAQMYTYLTDQDLRDVIAYVRSFPERKGGVGRLTQMRPMARIGIVTDKFRPVAQQIEPNIDRTPPDPADAFSRGRYLVKTSCTECHGTDLQGSEFLKAPNLLIAAAYSEPDFKRLMHEGVGMGGRDLGLMSGVSRTRFVTFNDDEIRAIRTYLSAYVQGGGATVP
jgi:mono/diheme cytochrome c family protein